MVQLLRTGVSMTSRCGLSKPNPRELVGDFVRLAIGCLYGDANKRSAAACSRRTPKPPRAAVQMEVLQL
jgi:hypothetical protein